MLFTLPTRFSLSQYIIITNASIARLCREQSSSLPSKTANVWVFKVRWINDCVNEYTEVLALCVHNIDMTVFFRLDNIGSHLLSDDEDDENFVELEKSNVLLIGPTGSGIISLSLSPTRSLCTGAPNICVPFLKK